MTHDELPTGRELDSLIAEKIFQCSPKGINENGDKIYPYGLMDYIKACGEEEIEG